MVEQLPVAKQVWVYISKKPYVQEAIEQGIVNYSALARAIAKETEGASFDAVKVALRRAAQKLRKEKKRREQRAIALLKQSMFNIKNKIAVIRSPRQLDVETIGVSKTPSGYIYIVPEIAVERLKSRAGLEIEEGLSVIALKNPKEVESVPGVSAFLFSALAAENINIHHILDAREDTLLVVNEWDAPLAFKTLAEKLRIK